MSKSNSEYIGDGVYLSDDGYQLWLAVGDHHNNVVALDIEVFHNLMTAGRKRFSQIQQSMDLERLLQPQKETENEN